MKEAIFYLAGVAIGIGCGVFFIGPSFLPGIGHWRGQIDAMEGRWYVGKQGSAYIRLDHPSTQPVEVK